MISEEIGRISKEETTLTDEEILEKALHNVLSREKLEEPETQILISKVKRFLYNAFYLPLSNPSGCAGTIEPYVLIYNMEEEIRSLLSSYMDLWSFMYKHPGAAFEFEKYIREKFPEIISIKED